MKRFALSLLSKVVPTKNHIVFYSLPDYSGNPKALYEYARENYRDGTRLIWIVSSSESEYKLRRRGIESYSIYTKEGVMKLLQAKVVILSHMIFRPGRAIIKSRGQKYFYLPHGLPFKARYMLHYYPRWMDILIDLTITTSELAKYIHSSWLSITLDKFKITGYPRNDVLLRLSRDDAIKILSKILNHDLERSTEILLYAPTYRMWFHNANGMSLYRSEGKPFDGILPFTMDELSKLDHFLDNNNSLLLIRYHPFEEDYRVGKYSNIFNKFKNIKLIRSEDLSRLDISINDILPAVDCLITDYSSIFYDYLLLNRPVIFHLYDLDEYSRDRGFIIGKENLNLYLPGEITRNYNEFMDSLKAVLEGDDRYVDKRIYIARLFHKYIDDKSSERVWKLVSENLL